jgi:hypothetical protein
LAGRNAPCGKLQCSNVHTTIFGIDPSIITTPIGGTKCFGVDFMLGTDVPDPGMVTEGTPCGENMVLHIICLGLVYTFPGSGLFSRINRIQRAAIFATGLLNINQLNHRIVVSGQSNARLIIPFCSIELGLREKCYIIVAHKSNKVPFYIL